ncbi:MAG: 50S ribosomal protein L10 [Desulfobacterales bacterium]|nr:50S ribosomal protein L10 [Deltaproteobacteria bacterium]MBT8360488.1 50S ribosomal protein L10 [Deltaproteobacteria bacterium]NNK96790.1 50S ribosomal protein L10 [Desulfobacterales bacterium]
MNRDQKSAIVTELNELFTRAKFSVVTDYCGLKVSELEKIRTELRGCNSEIRIAKNTLLKRAVTDTACESLTDEFTGTTAIVVAYDDPVIPAKVLAKFAEDHERFQLRSAVLEGEKITVDNIVSLSKLPSKEILLGQLLSVMNGVPTALVRVLSEVPRTILYGLQAIKDQKEQA